MSNQEGWTWLINSRKWHYFRDSRSLCGKFLYLGSTLDELVQGNNASPDNCSACRRKREKEILINSNCVCENITMSRMIGGKCIECGLSVIR